MRKWLSNRWRSLKSALSFFRQIQTPISIVTAIGYVGSVAWTVVEFLGGNHDEALMGGFIGFSTSTAIAVAGLSSYVKIVRESLDKTMKEVSQTALHAIHGIHIQMEKLEPELADILMEQMTDTRRVAQQMESFVENEECELSVDCAIELLTRYTETCTSSIWATTFYDLSSWYDSLEWYEYRKAQREKVEEAKNRRTKFRLVRIFPLTEQQMLDDRIRINMQLQAEYGIEVRLMELTQKITVRDFVIFDSKKAIEVLQRDEVGPHGEHRYLAKVTSRKSTINSFATEFRRMEQRTRIFKKPEDLMNYKPTESMKNFQKLLTIIQETLDNGVDVCATNMSDIRGLQSEMYELLFILNRKSLGKKTQPAEVARKAKRGRIRRIFVAEQKKLNEDARLLDILRATLETNINSGIDVYVLFRDDPRVSPVELQDFLVGENNFLFVNYDPGFGYEDFSTNKFCVVPDIPSDAKEKNILIYTKSGGRSAAIDNYQRVFEEYLKLAHKVTRRNLPEFVNALQKV
ncbi:MAG: hypothetical protein ABSB28_05365 [Candidatus Bathyarchaeia archaeon]